MITPRLAIAIAILLMLGFTHIAAYVHGKSVGKQKWEKERAELTARTLELEQATRTKEQQLVEQRQKAEVKYVEVKREAARAATSAQSELDRLRNVLAAREARGPTQNPAAPTGTHDPAGLERVLLGQCATTLVEVAADADRLKAVVVGLQAYVKGVCQGSTE